MKKIVLYFAMMIASTGVLAATEDEVYFVYEGTTLLAAFNNDEEELEDADLLDYADYVSVGVYLNNPSLVGNVTGVTLDIQWPNSWVIGPSRMATAKGERGRNTSSKLFAVSEKDRGNHVFRYTVNPSGSVFALKEGESPIFRVYIQKPATGYYTVTLTEPTKANGYITSTVDKFSIKKMSSYVKIETPSEGTFAPEGLIPSDIAIALKNETGLTSIDLTNCTGVNGALPFVNACSYTFPAEGFTANGVSHTRTIGAGNFASVVFPVDMPVGLNCYVCTGVENGIAQFSNPTGNVLPAGETGLVVGDVNYASTATVTLTEDAQAPFKRREDVSEGWYVLDNKLKQCNATNFKPFRGAFDIDETAEIRGFVLNTADGIITLDADLNKVESIYDLTGRKLQSARRGVNIINGEKRLVK